jgi:alanyl-tRNA synthetase
LKKFDKGEKPFILFTTYGFPFELTKELAKERGIQIDEEEFKKEMKKHQELSRLGSEQKFKGGLGDTSEMSVKYHTATHLLHKALRDVLGETVSQKGSNITPERLRFDFSFERKMTDEEKSKVEKIVNQKIQESLPVKNIIMKKDEAEKSGALHFFGDKYGDEVSVYFIGENIENAYSKEFCGGPHIENTGILGKFKITKEEAVSAGVRRIKAVLE